MFSLCFDFWYSAAQIENRNRRKSILPVSYSNPKCKVI